MKACMGGWCKKRETCMNYGTPDLNAVPADRLCIRGSDGVSAGEERVVLWKPAGAWERGKVQGLLAAAGVWDALA